MSARKSTSSWVPWKVRPSRRQALARLTRRTPDKKYIISVLLFIVMISALVVSAVGGITETAFARERNDRNWRENNGGYTQRNQNRNDTSRTQAPVTAAPPEQPTAAQTAPSATQTTTPLPTPASQRSTVATPVVASPAPEPVVNTAPSIATMASAQATGMESTPVTYTSNRISEETRNQLMIVSATAVVTSLVMYGLTLIGGGMRAAATAAPVRYKIPIKEVISN